MKIKKPLLTLIIPCKNKEKSLPNTFKVLKKEIDSLIVAQTISPNSFLYFIDDGSTDKTWQIICKN